MTYPNITIYSNISSLKQLSKPFINGSHPQTIVDILYNLLKQKFKNDNELLNYMTEDIYEFNRILLYNIQHLTKDFLQSNDTMIIMNYLINTSDKYKTLFDNIKLKTYDKTLFNDINSTMFNPRDKYDLLLYYLMLC
jgi:phosphopantetheine adenylyltransferase